MIYKNSLKVLFSNFNIVWKLMLYFLFVFVVCGVALHLLVSPIFELIRNAGFFTQFVDLYTEFVSSLNLVEFFEALSLFFNDLISFVVEHISSIWFYLIGVAIVLLFLNSFLFNLSNMPSCVSLNYYMGSMTKQGFFTSFWDNFGKNLKFQLCYFLATTPLNLLYMYLFVLSLKIFGISWFLNLFGIFLIIIGIVLLFAFKFSIFASWAPVVVIMNYSVWRSFRMSFKIVFRRFGRVFGSAIGIVLSIFALNVFFGLFTFMTGLIVSIPVSFLLYSAFGMVVVYDVQGMRYYVDVCNVVTPKKRAATDRLVDMKYVV